MSFDFGIGNSKADYSQRTNNNVSQQLGNGDVINGDVKNNSDNVTFIVGQNGGGDGAQSVQGQQGGCGPLGFLDPLGLLSGLFGGLLGGGGGGGLLGMFRG
jgi:hypothetical protein